ncbi:hypothetical protein V1L52_12980 [Treponema sp. HNW]|uniref:hypothetical protein n=1 Tax=Treponema sp. HNW TaxID=3116654 RepID=UPI003D129CC8
MEKGLIIAGKDFPESTAFVNAALANGFSAAVSVSEQNKEQLPSEPVKAFVWQRSSSLSARSFVLEAQTSLNKLTHAVLIFDTALYAKAGDDFFTGTRSLTEGIDLFIASYMYITRELIDRFKKTGGGTLCFVYKSHPGKSDYIKLNARLKETVNPASPLLSAAGEAFKSFAENTAASLSASPTKSLLIEYASASGQAGEEETADYLFSLPQMHSTEITAKTEKSVRWLRPGAKFPAVINLFNR